ncbi:hypothetical protein NQ318_001684 [Aromia moschata]|uniref:Ribosomal protein 50S-L18Ae/60S-L20/60S-L18A domain-containing protein n=1 Tax=Aromia moschata TaxID=1265417 RepID=A0AAV8X646_9CUCU|nr:hypothetical protein NQ318_001684 [Aromia moschata]
MVPSALKSNSLLVGMSCVLLYEVYGREVEANLWMPDRKSSLKEYEVIGRKLPTEKEKNTPLYKMRIFAPDQIVAKSRFWYFLRQLKKFKKSTGGNCIGKTNTRENANKN